MKTSLIGSKVSTAVLFLTTALFMSGASIASAAEDLNAIYQQGRAAYYKGDLDTAYRLLSRVAAANPKHAETANMLAYIRANYQPKDDSLKNQYATVILPKIEMSDVTLTEAIEGLRAMSKNASGGKITPNVIVKGAELGEKKFSLSLSNVPLSEALNYVTQLVGAKATYEKHAVILAPEADTPTSTAATK
ncbi:tetratricopeptide repeat protein [Prosthecobacter sp.]|uniref:tetratricopeptide repeat protein n=1 Tax=Prosthecobacter sp. TaxID=1965333 RepID=UPI0037830526